MRRLTLILSDLYLPEDAAGGDVPQPPQLPRLSELLRFAGAPRYIGDWRRWLMQRVAGGERVDLPLASLCAYQKIPDHERLESAWLATPIALEARLDHVRLLDRGLLYLDTAERTACCAEFNQVFGPELALHDCGERALVLTGLAQAPVRVADPARLLGAEIGPAFPGPEASDLRRLWAEIEMWLHGSTLNAERGRAGRRPVSALWLWGRDAAPREPGPLALDVAVYGRDPLVSGLSREPQRPPESLAQLDTRADHAFAEFAPLTGEPAESLHALDSNWFGAARAMLAGGALSEVTVVANDRAFHVTPHSHWQFWRPRRGWLENLARRA
jgi:hypothetical protein